MQHQINVNYTSPSGTVVSAATATGNTNYEANFTVSASATNQEFDAVDIPVTGLQAVLLYSATAMTVYTNHASGSSPDQTITLVAGVPYFWTYGNGANPITTAITKLFVTSTAGGTLNVRSLYNS